MTAEEQLRIANEFLTATDGDPDVVVQIENYEGRLHVTTRKGATFWLDLSSGWCGIGMDGGEIDFAPSHRNAGMIRNLVQVLNDPRTRRLVELATQVAAQNQPKAA
ncbi:MAG: hypothetical protein AB4911_25415 [Oscillochloridaceae bacterium umkhey_bin13]